MSWPGSVSTTSTGPLAGAALGGAVLAAGGVVAEVVVAGGAAAAAPADRYAPAATSASSSASATGFPGPALRPLRLFLGIVILVGVIFLGLVVFLATGHTRKELIDQIFQHQGRLGKLYLRTVGQVAIRAPGTQAHVLRTQ